MPRKLSVAELRDLFEHGAKREDLNRIRQYEDVLMLESTGPNESKETQPTPVRAQDENQQEKTAEEDRAQEIEQEREQILSDNEQEQEQEQEREHDHEHEHADPDEHDLIGNAENHLILRDFQLSTEREVYEVIFDVDSNEGLGMVVQQQDEEVPGTSRIRERLVVEMITESGAAAQHGITEGSILLKVNGIEVLDKTYIEALNLLKQPTRPLILEFEKGLGIYTTQGYCFKVSTGSLNPPKRFNSWKLRYYVLGGPVAGNNVLQLYKSKSDFDQVVVAVVSRKPVTQKFKAYLLTNEYNCSLMKQKRYDSRPSPLEYFSIRRPRARFNKVMHVARIPSDSTDGIRTLHAQISEMTTLEP
jgi:hypothetical protein